MNDVISVTFFMFYTTRAQIQAQTRPFFSLLPLPPPPALHALFHLPSVPSRHRRKTQTDIPALANCHIAANTHTVVSQSHPLFSHTPLLQSLTCSDHHQHYSLPAPHPSALLPHPQCRVALAFVQLSQRGRSEDDDLSMETTKRLLWAPRGPLPLPPWLRLPLCFSSACEARNGGMGRSGGRGRNVR